MSEPISAAAAAFANWAYATFFSAAGYGTAAHSAIVATLYYGGQIAISAAVSAGLNSLARAQINEPEAGKLTRRQPRPERMLQVGDWSRISGAYMFRESRGNKLGVVLAQCDGRGEVRSVWLNDDLVTRDVDGWVQEGDDGRFGGGDLIQIKTRDGETPETAFSELFAHFGDLWTVDHRGDGIQSLMMFAQHRSKESFNKHFPNGEPIPTAERRTFCFDWRDPTQDRDDPTTWKASGNPVVWLVFVRWHRLGMKWDRCIAPVLADLTVEADYCDELVARKDGSTEPRYRCAFSYGASAEPQAYLDQITASFDGWMTTDGQGHLIIKAGRYDAPVFSLTEDHILGYRGWRAFDYREDATNALKISYVSANQSYTEVECDPWVDEADVEAVGEEREASLQLLSVNSHSQARRLAKRQMARMNAPRRGQILADVHGLNALGKRFIRLQNAELASMADVVVEVLNVDVDLESAMVVFDVIQADPNVDAWNPATEEGIEPDAQGRPPREPLDVPNIDEVGVFTDSIGETTGPRLSIQATGPERGDETWSWGWRVVGDVSWVEGTAVDIDSGSPVLLETGFVAAASIEVRVAYTTGGGDISDWSVPVVVDATISAPTPPPTNLAASVAGDDVTVAWRYPTTPFAYVKVKRHTALDYAAATELAAELTNSLGGPGEMIDANLAPGAKWYWIRAFADDDTPSGPVGPVQANVTQEPGANILLVPTDFTNANWQKAVGGLGALPVVTGDFAIAPDGTNTADRVQFANGGVGGGDQSYLVQVVAGSNIAQAGAIWLRSNTGGDQTIYIRAGDTFSVVTVKPYWQRFAVAAPSAPRQFFFGLRGSVTGAVATADVLAWQGHVAV